ncbi:MAG: hypothetical protein ACOC7W_04490, partial [Desulfosalsimonas sp.]
EASIFVNQINRNGTPVNIKKVLFQKLYKDRDGKWQRTASLDTNDIPKAMMVLAKAYDYLTGKNEEEYGFVP